MPGFMPGSADPASPFAQPFEANPYPSAEQSPFAQPYGANPFADVAADSAQSAPPRSAPGNHFAAPAWSASAPGTADNLAHTSSAGAWNGSTPYQPWNNGNGRAAARPGNAPFANDFSGPSFSAPAQPGNGFGASAGFSPFGGDSLRSPARELEQAPAINDVWTPPDGGLDDETGIVPEMAFRPISGSAGGTARRHNGSTPADQRSRWPDVPGSDQLPGAWGTSALPAHRPGTGGLTQQPTAPVPTPSRLPAVISENPADRALGTVLVDGALLTENKLEVLKGIQQMLSSVDMSFKLGELALLFKFLSPDQLLAALLVSRGLVSPQQIAGLGRVKQELAGSGMDYDLEALLSMFHILPPEQLHRLRAELA